MDLLDTRKIKMKIYKLIKELQKYPEDAHVFFECFTPTWKKHIVSVTKVDLENFDIIVERYGERIEPSEKLIMPECLKNAKPLDIDLSVKEPVKLKGGLLRFPPEMEEKVDE
jgi:hypothetical protein